jgi:DNA-directed RNA polymerase subunit F
MVFHDIHIAMEEAKNILYKIQKEQNENIKWIDYWSWCVWVY